MKYIIIAGMVQAFFFSLLIISKKNKSFSDKVLFAWLFTWALHHAYLFVFTIFLPSSLKYVGYDIGVYFLYYILIYIYTHSLVSSKVEIKKYVKHFLWIPFIYLLYMPLFMLSVEEKLEYLNHQSNEYFYLNIILGIYGLFLMCYMIMTLRLLILYKKHMKDEFSSFKKNNLNWILYLLFGLVLMVLLYLLLYAILYTLKIDLRFSDYFGYLAIFIYIFGVGFCGFRQGKIFIYDDTYLEGNKKPEENEKDKKEITPKEKKFSQKLKAVMEEQEYYLNNELTLHTLAKELQIGPHYLSFVVNQVLNTTFYDFVNSYRIDAVKRKIENGEHIKYTLLSIAIDCGFNSKSSFNRLFKKHTGLTPSLYITNQKNSIKKA